MQVFQPTLHIQTINWIIQALQSWLLIYLSPILIPRTEDLSSSFFKY